MKRHALDLRDQGGVLVRGRLTKDGVKWATMLPQFYGDFTGRVVGVVDRDFDTAEGLKTDEPRPRATLITLGAHEVENYILNAAAIAEAAARQRRDRGANAEATLTEEQVEEALEQALQGRVKETRNWLRPKYRHQLGGDACQVAEEKADDWWEERKADRDWLLRHVPGKEVWQGVCRWLRDRGVSLRPADVAVCLDPIPDDLQAVLDRVHEALAPADA